MKTILVASDSHRHTQALQDLAFEIERRGGVDLVIHLGDVMPDAEYLRSQLRIPLLSVPGNCDWPGPDESTERETLIEGVKVLYCHGHTLRVKWGLDRLYYRAQEKGAGLALFGHTHEPYSRYEGGVWLVNPGALQDRRYALIALQDGTVADAQLLSL